MLTFNNKEKVLIFGVGSCASNFYKLYGNRYKIIGFLDNNCHKKEQNYFNKKIYSPKDLLNLAFDKIIIASDYYEEINHQLIHEYRINKDKIECSYSLDFPEKNIFLKKIKKIIIDKYQEWLFNTDSRFFYKVNAFFFQGTDVQIKTITWLDELVKYKIKIFRQSEMTKIYGPNILQKDCVVKSINIPEISLFRFAQAQIGTVGRSVILNDGTVIIERVKTAFEDNADYTGGHLEAHGRKYALVRSVQAKKISKGIAVTGCNDKNYYHWVIEILSQLQYLDELPEEYKRYPILISENSQKIASIKEFFSFYNIKRSVIFLDSNESYLVNDMLFITSPNFQIPNLRRSAWNSVDNVYFRKESILYLRHLVFNNINTETYLSNRIFLARKGTLRSYNQKEVFHLLYKYGFIEVYLEDLCFSKQVTIMQSAEVVIGASGAAWTNLIFCKQETKALSWMAKEFGNSSCFSCLAHYTGIKMDYLTYKAGTNNTRELYYKNYTIDVSEIKNWLDLNLINII